MPAYEPSNDQRLIEHALRTASHTRLLRVDHNLRRQVAPAYQALFGHRPTMIVADVNTFAAAGKDVFDNLRASGQRCSEPHVFCEPELHAEYRHVETIEQALASNDAIAVAVGAGTINDLVKLASHHVNRPYFVVATAASMDGYLARGASITRLGSKQTFDCPAPVGVVADLEVIESAPAGMSASGFADLLAKIMAGADWLVADALAVEPIDAIAWETMHGRLRTWVDEPDGVRRGDPMALHGLFLGLAMSGLAMQRTGTSRVASGAEHQFSHLWDMQAHVHNGGTQPHGFQVGIGTLASSALYEQFLQLALTDLDTDRLVSQWPDVSNVEVDVRRRFDSPALTAKALEETRAKHLSADELRERLSRLRTVWPALREGLQEHLLPLGELSERLTAAGCPTEPCQIGVSPRRLRASYRQAYHIRRRFTVLDLAELTGRFDASLSQIFGPQGRWPLCESPSESE